MIKKILIVDDIRDNLYMLETLLKGHGFEVISAENGKDALDNARLNPPDLIITDILMPVMDGYTLCRQWKADDKLKHIPLVFYTATYTGDKDETFALSLGADRFIIKPQEPDIFMKILKEVLGREYTARQMETKPLGEEMEFFRQYNEIMFKKLEKKMSDLEITNHNMMILEEKYQLSFKHVMDVVYTIDNDLNISSVSPSVETLLGYKPQDFVGRSASDLGNILTPESFEQAITDISMVLKGETLLTKIYSLLAKDGTIKYVEVSGSPIMLEGKVIGMISVAREITERKRVEEALSQSEEKYRTILENMQEAYFEVDLAGTITFANNAACRNLGYSKDELIGMNYRHYTDKENAKILFQAYNKVYTSGEPLKELFWQRTKKDGTKRHIEGSVSLKKDSEGKPIGFKGIDRDITERKLAEEALSESERKLREAQEMAHLGHWIWDVRTGKVEWSEEVFKIFQLDPDSFTPQIDSIQDLSPWPEDHERDKELIRKATKSHEGGSYEQRFLRPDNSTGYYFSSFQGKYDDNDHLVSIVGTVQDITERKRTEVEIIGVNRALRMLSNANRALVRIADEATLLTEVCRIIVEEGGYLMARVGFAEQDKAAIERGYKSNIALPLISEGRPFGELAIYSVEADAFDAEEVEILKEMADNLAFGITALRTRVKRDQTLVALYESEERYRLIAENTADTIAVFDLNFNPTYVSPSILKLRGYTVEEAMAQTLDQMLTPDSLQQASKTLADQLALEPNETADTTRTTLIELEEYCKDGSTIWVELAASFLRDKNFKPTGMLTVTRNITERRQAAKALKESESKYRLLADNVDDVLFVLDINLNYTYASPSLKTLMGYEPEELLTLRFSETVTPSSWDMAVRTLSGIMEREKSGLREINKPQMFELEMKRKDGSTVWTELKASFIRDENKRPVGIISVSRDITERKRTEDKLQQTLDSLRKAVGATIQVMVSAVEIRDPYTAGHQVRTADIARAIATEMKLTQEKIDGIRMAGTIHDIGKLSIPAEILSKPTKLTNIEFRLIKEHSHIGYEILKDIESPWPLAEIVYQHHERMNGSGYPRKLKGAEILIEARIMAVADVVEAMASHRPYRAALGIDAALEEIEKNKGTHYDETVADACLRLFREKGYQLI